MKICIHHKLILTNSKSTVYGTQRFNADSQKLSIPPIQTKKKKKNPIPCIVTDYFKIHPNIVLPYMSMKYVHSLRKYGKLFWGLLHFNISFLISKSGFKEMSEHLFLTKVLQLHIIECLSCLIYIFPCSLHILFTFGFQFFFLIKSLKVVLILMSSRFQQEV